MTRRKGAGKGKGQGYKNLPGFPKDPKVHSDSRKGIKQPQKVNYIPSGVKTKKSQIKEPIFIVGNINTLDVERFRKEKPLSYAFFVLGKRLENSGLKLLFINQDKNRVYFKILNKITGHTTPILELSNQELLNMDYFLLMHLLDSAHIKPPIISGDDRANYIFEDELF